VEKLIEKYLTLFFLENEKLIFEMNETSKTI